MRVDRGSMDRGGLDEGIRSADDKARIGTGGTSGTEASAYGLLEWLRRVQYVVVDAPLNNDLLPDKRHGCLVRRHIVEQLGRWSRWTVECTQIRTEQLPLYL